MHISCVITYINALSYIYIYAYTKIYMHACIYILIYKFYMPIHMHTIIIHNYLPFLHVICRMYCIVHACMYMTYAQIQYMRVYSTYSIRMYMNVHVSHVHNIYVCTECRGWKMNIRIRFTLSFFHDADRRVQRKSVNRVCKPWGKFRPCLKQVWIFRGVFLILNFLRVKFKIYVSSWTPEYAWKINAK